MDMPSSLLLQIERSASAIAAINAFLATYLQENQHNFRSPGAEMPRLIEYQSFRTLAGNEKQIESYLERIERALHVLRDVAVDVARWPIGIIATAASGIASWHAARAAADKKHRLEEFQGLTAMALELKSLRVQLEFVALLPPSDEFLEIPATYLLSLPPPAEHRQDQ
jgi:hypothetical protein